jgi:hypothetical protein
LHSHGREAGILLQLAHGEFEVVHGYSLSIALIRTGDPVTPPNAQKDIVTVNSLGDIPNPFVKPIARLI